MQPLRKAESFTIIEDLPTQSPVHEDKRIQDAVRPAFLVVDSEGNKYLIFEREE